MRSNHISFCRVRLYKKAHSRATIEPALVAALITDFELQCHGGIARAFSDEVVTKGLDRVRLRLQFMLFSSPSFERRMRT